MLITNNHLLEDCCAQLSQDQVIAVDTEFMRSHVYYPQFSLIQISGAGQTFAVDMLLPLDHTPLKKLLSNTSSLKIIHAAKQDLEVIFQTLQLIPPNIFDTQIAGIFLGYADSPSFETLVFDFLGIRISKSLHFSNWLARPLSEGQLKYALSDASLLYKLFFRIETVLKERKMFDWTLEESAIIATSCQKPTQSLELLKRFTGRMRTPLEFIKCYRILVWREEKAKALNIPRGHVLKDEAIMDMCVKKIQDIEALFKARIFSRSLDRKDILSLHDSLVSNITTEEELEVLEELNSTKKLQRHKTTFAYMLKILLEAVAQDIGIQPSFIASSGDLAAFIAKRPSRIDNSWRYEVFGQRAAALNEGRILLGYKDGIPFFS